MKIVYVFCLLASAWILGLWHLGGMKESVARKWGMSWSEEKKALALAKENRLLKTKLSSLQYELNQEQAKNKFIAAKAKPQRTIASVPSSNPQDLVNYEVYKWTPEKLLAIGEKELHFKNYEKSAQFYNELIQRFPKHALVSDRVLFGAGVAAFETGKRYDWSARHLERLVKHHPKSNFYRGAKLWLALAQYQQGEHEKFLSTVEEFRLKYRNTEEWKILSRYYEDISVKVKK